MNTFYVINVNLRNFIRVDAENEDEARHAAYKLHPEWIGAWIWDSGTEPTVDELDSLVEAFSYEG